MTTRKPRRLLAGGAIRAQPDRRLVSLARTGNQAALEEIIRRYRPVLVRYAASIVPPDRADDVTQDALARALPGISFGEEDLNLRPWLYTIVRNAAFNDLRDAGPPLQQLDENYDGVEQPPQVLERSEQLKSLLGGLASLPHSQREALVKREMEGLSHTAIGAELGVSAGAARQLIHRARNALREGLGSLVPMPVLRQILDAEATGGVAAAGGGGALAVKATAAVLATGAIVTAGVVFKDSHPQSHRTAPIAVSGRSRRSAPAVLSSAARKGQPKSGRISNHEPRQRSTENITAGSAIQTAVRGALRTTGAKPPLPGVKDTHPSGPPHGAVGGNGTQGAQTDSENSGTVPGSNNGGAEGGGGGSGAEVPPQKPASEKGEPPASGGAGESEAPDSSGDDSRETTSSDSSEAGDSNPSKDSGASGSHTDSNTSGSSARESSQD